MFQFRYFLRHIILSGAVRIIKVEPLSISDSTIEITWAVKPSDQSRVRGYRIIVHPSGNLQRIQQYTVDESVNTYLIDGLSSNTDYNVTVQARTDSGYHQGTSRQIRTEDPSTKII